METKFFYTIWFSLFLCFIASRVLAVEVTNYTVSISKNFHYVTAAFENMSMKGKVRCVIELYDKPIGMGEKEISGVGTIKIFIPGGTVGDTRAKCQSLQE